MGQAARAIIIEDNKILVMHRNKHGSEYFTLVGGRVDANETPEQALVREVKEETGMDVTRYQLVFTEHHTAPYNEQYIFLCEVAPHKEIAVQATSEEAMMNKLDANIHQPMWSDTKTFSKLAFRTPQLQKAIEDALENGFPVEPKRL